jgi:cellulose synthase operon protein C
VARCRLSLGQTEAARATLTQILQRQSDWTPAVASLALMDVREGKPDAALKRAAAHAAMRPGELAPLVLLGDVQTTAQRYADAAASYARAAQLRDSAIVAVKEARARQFGALDDMEAPLLRWLDRQPGDLMVRNVLAELYASTGRSAKAIGEYELLAAQRPNEAAVLNNLAWLYFETNDPRALELAERAYRLAPHVAAIADTYGWILTQQGKAVAAIPILQKADVDSGGQFEIGYHHAVALAKAGHASAARQRLTELLATGQASKERIAAERLLGQLNSK